VKRRGVGVTALAVSLGLLVAACTDVAGDRAGDEDTPVATTTTQAASEERIAPGPSPDFRGMSLSAPSCAYGGEFETIEALDELTVRFTLCDPDVAFPTKVASAAFGVVPSEYLESTGGGLALVETPIGTGPFVFDSWDRGGQIVMQANREYWGDVPGTGTLVMSWNEDPSERLGALDSGQADAIDDVTFDESTSVQSAEALDLLERPPLDVFYLGFNRDRGPLTNERVRQAIGYAVDRERIIDRFFPGGSIAAEQFLPPSIPGHSARVTGYEFDPERALLLLERAGFPDGFEINLSYADATQSFLPEPELVATDIRSQLANVGIIVTLDAQTPEQFSENADAGLLDFFLSGWSVQYPDATNYLDKHFGGSGLVQFGEPFRDVAEILDEAAQVSGQARRNRLYDRAARLLKVHAPMIPIAHAGSAVVWDATAAGANASPLRIETFIQAAAQDQDTFVWTQTSEPEGLYCADETDSGSLRACAQVVESLLSFDTGTVVVQPGLAVAWEPNADLTVWTFELRSGVKFHDGSAFDANDVVLSYIVQWDQSNPLHVGRSGRFSYFSAYFGEFLNARG
jgi:peptide/nickel transport system substrate-binding protein